MPLKRLTAATLQEHLVLFARDLLEVLAGDVSLALNRLAIGQASRDGSKLGSMLQERGRRQIGRRAMGAARFRQAMPVFWCSKTRRRL
jgi:hypothetical protein